MSKQLKDLLLYFALTLVMCAALGYAVYAGAKADSLEKETIRQAQEIKVMNADLKSYSGLLLDRDIKIQEKDSTIQQLSSQNEGLIWQLQNGEEK